jgi:hypothetical protein
MGRRTVTLVAALVALAAPALAQTKQPEQKPVQVRAIAAKPEDVATIDGIVKAFYDVISGPAGQPRQWDRDRTLYYPTVQFFAVDVRGGKAVVRVMDHQEYVDSSDAFFVKNGFFEREVDRKTDNAGNVAHVWSTYETRATADGPVTSRGVNTIQLIFDGTRWWITSVAWQSLN